MSELSVGHHRGGGGDRLNAATVVPGGLLGADYDGRSRSLSHREGVRWSQLDPESPLAADRTRREREGRRVHHRGERRGRPRADERLCAVREHRGQDRRVHARVESRGHGRAHGAGRPDRERVARSAIARGSRAISRRSTPRAAGPSRTSTCPNTGNQGHDYFKRYFYPQAQKDAVIVDERFNGGGQFADYYIDILRRPAISYWAMRYGDDMKTPTASHPGSQGDADRRDGRLRRRHAAVDVPAT